MENRYRIIFSAESAFRISKYLRIRILAHEEVEKLQSWALALYFQVRSLLILYPWIAIALALILAIFRFAHRSIVLKKTSGLLPKKQWFALAHRQ